MKLSTKNVGSNYLAEIVTLPAPMPHPNADRLRLVTIKYNTVITGLTAKEGDLCVYFPVECAIHKGFLSYTNSFAHSNLNRDTSIKGFFNDQGRVKAVKLRGLPSEGYIVPLHSVIEWLATMEDGNDYPSIDLRSIINQEFDTIRLKDTDVLLCEKYVPKYQRQKGPANMPKLNKAKRHDRLLDGQFRFHVDTASLKRNIHLINPDDIVTISYKMHGTSAVFANVLTKRKLGWAERLLKFFGVKIQESEYSLLWSSRTVLKNQYLYSDKKHNHFYKEDIWGLAADRIKDYIEPGITIYAEIVGQMPNGRWIQKHYDYGTKEKDFEIYVYRMTYTNSIGNVLELTTNQIKDYCNKYQLKTVPIYWQGKICHYYPIGPHSGMLDEWRAHLIGKLSNYLEGTCHMSVNKVPAEGIVITVEKQQYTAYKLKSFAFLEKESIQLDTTEQQDAELL